QDVAVGDVWLCAGQSNMDLPLRMAHDPAQEIAAADYPGMRWFTVPRRPSSSPLTDVQARWQRTSPGNAAGLSALAFFFGRDLHLEQGVPVGLIVTAWGGTRAEAWMGLDMFGDEPLFEPLLRHREQVQAQSGGAVGHRVAGSLWNGMVAPLVPSGLRGVIWYQGEAHAEQARQYRELFSALIRGWRRAWGTELPFLFAQLPNFRERARQPGESTWAELREAQASALALPATGMAVTLDLGEVDDVHGSDKRELGRRLALLARSIAYGEDIPCRSPELAAVAIEESGAVRLTFEHTAGGLATRDGAAPRGFALAGEDRVFHWAEAEIAGESVVVRSGAVPHPVAVRYAWADNPDCNLIGGAGLPVPSLRSDDWPITEELGGLSPTEERRRARAKRKRPGG
ncbi:MAG TPA: sialate O-acetylesterase, partial [bacterium]